jgi:nucleoside-diphosphate-sugar epimerase
MVKRSDQLLLTGATGFIGRAVSNTAIIRGRLVRPVLRSRNSSGQSGSVPNGSIFVPSIDANTDWSAALAGVDVVVHCAARAHVIADTSTSESQTLFRSINVDGTLNLAHQAAYAGVRRFIFLSSIGVNGVQTFAKPFAAHDAPAPHSPYTVSKHEAEVGLRMLASQTGLEVVIIRPPLVYGPGAPGNFGSLMRWLGRGWPLPFGLVTKNRRSLVGLDNLVDLIMTCVDHPRAANQTFLVSDGYDLSTTELVSRLGHFMNRPARLVPIPVALIDFAAGTLGKRAAAQSLLGSLQVDISKTCEVLDWKPPMSLDEGLRRAVQQRL